ncbi:hypothetical protein [Arthrobacter sp. AZCC_0090]|uniref:hypothetical protein n=1 Tax=Arthrobacter sp. AZCC_0090 TaxID=2735881 RepID=UPI0017C8E80F|nr:hypothetical protein [Arthrobacter sp. AZCC_0090]MBB6404244.1 hypothetical protein [Arthrobacter sp. AZCC_0090]
MTLLLGGCAAGGSPSIPSSPDATANRQWLLTADPKERTLYVNDVSDGNPTGSIGGVELGVHAGTIQLGRGRVAFVDESKPSLDILEIDKQGKPKIERSFNIPDPKGKWERAGWITTDATKRYVAVGSDFDGSTEQQVTLVDLENNGLWTVSLHTNEVTLATTGKAGTEEMHTFLAGDPLRLVVSSGGKLDAYLVTDISSGNAAPAPHSSTVLGAYPHGPVMSNAGDSIGSTLNAGVETVPVTKDGFGTPVSADYQAGIGQSYRPRMAPDGTTFVGAQAARVEKGAAWNSIPAFLMSGSMTQGKIASVPLGAGIATRAAVSSRFAAVVLTQAGGDNLILIDRNEETGLYDGGKAAIALEPLKAGPKPGQDSKAAETRFVAATKDGETVFVSRGGEGVISQIATSESKTKRSITFPTTLASGGYLAVVSSEEVPFDLGGR